MIEQVSIKMYIFSVIFWGVVSFHFGTVFGEWLQKRESRKKLTRSDLFPPENFDDNYWNDMERNH